MTTSMGSSDAAGQTRTAVDRTITLIEEPTRAKAALKRVPLNGRAMEREIVKFGARVLRRRCKPVGRVDRSVATLVEDLFDSMYAADGVGLAAPQIGVARRVLVVDVSHQEPENPPAALIDPRILTRSGTQIGEEGCLSFPDLYGEVKRAESIRVAALNVHGEPVEFTATGFFSRALQHEIDHLDGILFIDHLSPLKRQLMRGSLKRLKKIGEAWDREHRAAERT